uniref:HAT C-terminal dimerisation domain-containing protein n=1 Tax=Oryzias melastigma TaxID=30732 RepID=A0A3B3C4Y6_ORYME
GDQQCQKQKKHEEYRTFQDEWTEEFALVERAGSAVCLICNDKIASMKRSNVKRHFDTRHATFASKYPAGDSRKKASIVRNGKPFTDGEYAKTFMMDVANELFDDLPNEDKIMKRIQDMPLSARTVHDPIFHSSVLAVLPMKGSTRGEDLFKSFMEFTQEKNLPMDKLLSVCTDGAPCMVRKNKGFVALLREHEKRPILSFHCILHQEALCAQMFDGQFDEVMSLVIRVINFIVAQALNDRQFKTLLDEVENHYHGLLLHNNVRWLSRRKVLSIEHPELAETEWLLKFYYLVDITEHLNQLNGKMQGIGNTLLSLQQAVFAFENKLELFIMDLKTCRLLHFEKLKQFKDAYTASEPTQKLDFHQLAAFTSSLLKLFKSRFGEFREHTRLFKFITHPIECSLNAVDLSYIPGVSIRDFEAEVADLKASDMWGNNIARQKAELASKHMWTEMKKLPPEDQLIIKAWNALPVTYHTLQRVSIAVLTMFGSTYACEQSFSHLKNIKSNLRSRLTDESLNACMKLNLTKYQPDYKAISKFMQHQKSH